MEDEIWKPIPSYEGCYEASSLGRVRSVDRIVVTNRINRHGHPVLERRKSIVRKPHPNKFGYLLVHMSKGGIERTEIVHKLICRTFHGAPKGKQVVAHWDGNPQNNRAENLRWTSVSDNLADRHRHGTAPTGENQYGAKLTWEIVRKIRKRQLRAAEYAREYGVHENTIRKIWKNEKWIEGRPIR